MSLGVIGNPTPPTDQAREEERDRRLRHRICFLLDSGSLCLFALFAIHLLPVLMESKPTQAAWQGTLVATIDQEAILAFVGFVLMHLAAFLNPKKQILRKRLRQVRHLAVVACVGFLLLIPIQLASSLQAFRAIQAKQSENAEMVNRLLQIRESIFKATSNQALNARLVALAEPELSLRQKEMRLVDLQRELLKENDQRQAIFTRVTKQESTSASPFVEMITRVAGMLGWCAAFAAGAVPWGSKKALLERLRPRYQRT
jgi:hypothetical protein